MKTRQATSHPLQPRRWHRTVSKTKGIWLSHILIAGSEWVVT